MESPTIEYTAQLVSPRINGEVKLVITDKALVINSLFDTEEAPFAEINALSLADYAVKVKADAGVYVFSRLGNWCQPFYDLLCEAYNKAVLRSLFVKEEPIITVKGNYNYTEAATDIDGAAPIHVYDNSVVILPTDLGARRIPLCFTNDLQKGDFELTLKLDTGESYTLAKLGYETAPFADAVEKQIRALRERTIAAAKEIDASLSVIQASQIAKLAPQGAAVSFEQLNGIAPSFTAALEEKIKDTRAAEGYETFKEISDPAKIRIGFRKNEGMFDGAAEGTAVGSIEGLTDGTAELTPDGTSDDTQPEPYLLWLIAPSPDGQFAAVEFAEENSATFVYKTRGDFDGFAMMLNRAIEAIDFRREVIRLSDEELRKPENADYFMASKRTAALRFIRSNFVGRVIHSSPDAWKRKLKEFWGL